MNDVRFTTPTLVLKITGTNCKEIPNFQDEAQVDNVESFVSHKNPIEEINSSNFKALSKLKMVMISRSGIKTLPKDTFGNSKYLEIIILSYNKIVTIDSWAFKDLDNLKHISLKGNQLTKFTADITNSLIKLESINLSLNNLQPRVVKEFLENSKDSHGNRKIKYLNFYKNNGVGIVLSPNQKKYVIHDSEVIQSLDEIIFSIFFGRW